MESLFSSTPMKFLFAFIVVFALIGVVAWVVRRFGNGGMNAAGARGRQPRLALLESAPVDARRRLLLIRRDNVEHLLLVGGPTDVVVETNALRASQPARDAAPARNAGATDTLPRPVPLDEANLWPLQPEPGPRPRPASLPEDVTRWTQPAEPAPRAPQRGPEPPPVAADINPLRPAAPRPAPEPPRVAAAAEPNGDHNLADMASRLEAALRRPAGPADLVPEPLRAPRNEAHAARIEPKLELPKAESSKAEAPPVEPAKSEAKPTFTSLEQEMASLLGRPPGGRG
ncbi:MAG: flagellar biosynthetic protein FliO [Pseudorhodoplanes sp.]